MNENRSDNRVTCDRDDEIRSIVGTLDELVPRDESWIELHQYGGGADEGQMIGNRNGYRRLGIEFLKATLDVDPETAFGVDLEYLVSPDSTINFDWFELSDTPTSEASTKFTWFDRVLPIGCLIIFAIASIIFIVGIVFIVQWIQIKI